MRPFARSRAESCVSPVGIAAALRKCFFSSEAATKENSEPRIRVGGKFEMRVGFVPSSTLESSSSRMRCFWVVKYWPDAMILDMSSPSTPTETVVFQKGFSARVFEQIQTLKSQSRKIVWDLCDPDWWLYPREHERMAQHVDAVVCSTRALADDFATEFPYHSPWVIIDRQDPEFHSTVKQHAPTASPTLVWFGWAQNRSALHGTFGVLEKAWAHGRRFTLVILDEKPDNRMDFFSFPVQHRKWTLERFHEDLLSADIALLPPYPGPVGRLKSDNKKATAGWAGLPVVDGFDYLKLCELIDSADERRRAGLEARRMAETQHDVRQSVEEWKRLIETLTSYESPFR